MEYVTVPIIVVCCYIVGEIYKVVFKKNKAAYKLIPIILALVGACFALIIYFTNKEVLFNAKNIYVALMIGIASGVSATGTNQIIKQLFKK